MRNNRRRLITVILIVAFTMTPLLGLTKTYTGNQLLTSAIKSSGTLVWNIKTKFKKRVTITKALIVRGSATFGDALTDLVKLNGTVSSELGAIELDDAVHITGQLDLDQPLAHADLPTSGIVTALTAGENVTLTDNGEGSYTIAATDTDTDTSTIYSAGTGISLASTTFSATLGTSIDATELDASAVGASALASTAIQSGDIEIGDLPSIASTNLTDTTSIGLLGDNEIITGNWVNTTNPWADTEVVDTLTVSGGTIDNSTIGASTASTGNFSNLTLNGNARKQYALHQLPRANTLTTVDSTTSASTGSYTSITIGTDGFPVISYQDDTNENLVMAHMANEWGLNYWTRR